jgi:hypothetical protein
MESISGLPAHPLFVHAPVVLVPLLALWLIAITVRPAWRAKSALPILGATVVCTIATLMAVGSGEKFVEAVPELKGFVERHEELGEQTRNILFLLLVLVIVFYVIARRQRVGGAESVAAGLAHGVPAVCAVVAMAAAIWMMRTGHEGAKAVWSGVIPPK